MIYCVEDDSAIRDIEVYALRSTGFEAEGCESGAALFAALKKAPAELVILDVMLPGEDGLEILKKLRLGAATRTGSRSSSAYAFPRSRARCRS